MKDSAICHCGEYVKNHGGWTGHEPVELVQYDPEEIMTDREINIKIAELMGWQRESLPFERHGCRLFVLDGATGEAWWHENVPGCQWSHPDFINDLNAVREAEKLILVSSKPYSSNPLDHEDRRYLYELAKVCGLKSREELVLTCSDDDRPLLNKRAKPYPAPIELPRSALVMSHSIPANGYELVLIRATARQRCEALLRTLGKWKNE